MPEDSLCMFVYHIHNIAGYLSCPSCLNPKALNTIFSYIDKGDAIMIESVYYIGLSLFGAVIYFALYIFTHQWEAVFP